MGSWLTKAVGSKKALRKENKTKYPSCSYIQMDTLTYGFPTDSSEIDLGFSGTSSSENSPSIMNDYTNCGQTQPRFTLYEQGRSKLSTSRLLAEINKERKRREARKLKMQTESEMTCGGRKTKEWKDQDNENETSIDNENEISIDNSDQSISMESSFEFSPPFIPIPPVKSRHNLNNMNGQRGKSSSNSK